MGDISRFLNFLSVLKFGNNKRGCEKKMDIHLIGISIFHYAHAHDLSFPLSGEKYISYSKLELNIIIKIICSSLIVYIDSERSSCLRNYRFLRLE